MDDESACVIRAQQGSDEAFTELVEAYQTRVYNLCYRMLGEHEAAEDAAQETFLRAYQHLHRYDCRRPFATWLLSIAAHYCIDGLRRRRYSTTAVDHGQEDSYLQLADAHAPNPESEVARSEEREQIQALLKGLNAIDRAVLVMRYWHECPETEIAESLDLTVGAVKSRLFRARRELAGLWPAESTAGTAVFTGAASLLQGAISASSPSRLRIRREEIAWPSQVTGERKLSTTARKVRSARSAAALRGLPAKVRNPGMPLVSVIQVQCSETHPYRPTKEKQ